MNGINQNKSLTICGLLTDVRSIRTRTDTPFVLCKVGEMNCKLFGRLAQGMLARQHEYEYENVEVYGHWDARSRNEFVIDGFGNQGSQASQGVSQNLVSDTRPTKAAMEVKDRFVVITIPRGATPEQLTRITNVAREALRDLETNFGGGRVVEMAAVHVAESDPTHDRGDIPY